MVHFGRPTTFLLSNHNSKSDDGWWCGLIQAVVLGSSTRFGMTMFHLLVFIDCDRPTTVIIARIPITGEAEQSNSGLDVVPHTHGHSKCFSG